MKQEKATNTFVFAFAEWNSNNPLSFQLQYLAQKLAELGNRIIVIVQVPGKTNENWGQMNISVFSWPSKRPTKLRDAWLLAKTINKNKPACVLANFAAVNWMMIVGKLLRVPIRLAWYQTLHKQIITDRKITAIENEFLVGRKKLVYKLATHVIPVSYAGFEELQRIYHLPQEKLKVIYNLLQDPINTVTQKSKFAQTHLTCVARLDYSKGHDVLLYAFQRVYNQFPHVCLRIIGDGPRKQELINLASVLGITDNVAFLGHIPHDDVIEELTNSYLTVHPARSESFGYAVLESIAVGTPVVASNVGGIPEIIRDGIDGFLVPPDSPEALANAIEKILKSPELRETLSKNARERFLSTFDLTKGVQDIITWLTATIDART